MTTDFTTLGLEQIGRVRRLTLDRPEQHNPLTPRCVRELLRAVDEAEADAGTSVLVIRSTGARSPPGTASSPRTPTPGTSSRTTLWRGT